MVLLYINDMNISKLLFSAILMSGLLYSCTAAKSIIGHYRTQDGLSSTDIEIAGDGTFSYKFTGEGFGRKEWSYGQWTKVNKNKLLFSSIRHDNLPMNVHEEKRGTKDSLIIVLPNDAVWRTDAIIRINGQAVEIPKNQLEFSLPSTTFPKIETISIEANINNDHIINELATNIYIKTDTYKVKDCSNNIFHLSFPCCDSPIDLFSCFYLKEFDDVITVKRNNLHIGDIILNKK